MPHKLRPINETRGPHGQFTSETAARVLRMRGGYARAAQLRANDFRDLEIPRAISALVRRAKSIEKASCEHCRPFHESVTRTIKALLLAKNGQPVQLDSQDAKLLGQ